MKKTSENQAVLLPNAPKILLLDDVNDSAIILGPAAADKLPVKLETTMIKRQKMFCGCPRRVMEKKKFVKSFMIAKEIT